MSARGNSLRAGGTVAAKSFRTSTYDTPTSGLRSIPPYESRNHTHAHTTNAIRLFTETPLVQQFSPEKSIVWQPAITLNQYGRSGILRPTSFYSHFGARCRRTGAEAALYRQRRNNRVLPCERACAVSITAWILNRDVGGTACHRFGLQPSASRMPSRCNADGRPLQ